MSTERLHGIIANLITPFRQDGSIDIGRLEQLIEQLIADGVHGLGPAGAAVLAYLSDEEREEVTETVCRSVAGRVPTVISVYSTTTDCSVRHAVFAEKAGATAVMTMPSSDWKLTADETFEYYDKLASAVSLPIMVYDTLMRPGGLMSMEQLLRLAKIPSVTMVKDSSGDMERLQNLLRRSEGRLNIFVGKNTVAAPALMLGCHGWSTTAPIVAPRQVLALYNASTVDRNMVAARRQAKELFPLLEALVKPGLPRSLLGALELIGRPAGPPRPPMKALLPAEMQDLARALEGLGEISPGAIQANG